MVRQYTLDEINQIINQVAEKHFPGDAQFRELLHSLVFSESSGDNLLAGDHGHSIGLLQANRKRGRGKGYSIEQLQDPLFNLELGMKEIVPAYEKAVAKGLTNKRLGAYVSRVAQRPAPGNEENVAKNWGVVIGGNGKINLPGTTTSESKSEVKGAFNEPVVVDKKAELQKRIDEILAKNPGWELANITDGVPEFKMKAAVNPTQANFLKEQEAMSAAMRDWKARNEKDKIIPPWFRNVTNLMNPKPVFSADNGADPLTKAISNFTSFVDNGRVTQNFGAKTFGFYGPNGHEGTDYSASVGTDLHGVKGWQVTYAGKGESYYGNKIVLRNPQTGESLEFAHLNDVNVKKGDIIPDDRYVIGHTGNSGYRPDGQAQQAHLHVNYYDPNGKKADVTKLMVDNSKNIANSFPIVPSFNQVVSNIKNKIVKPVMAAEGTATTPPTPQGAAPNYKMTRQALDVINKPNASFNGPTPQQVREFNAGAVSKPKNNLFPINDAAKDPKYNGNGYLVKPGDSLSKISRDLGVTLGTLMAKNNIQNPNKIFSGTVLKY